MAPSLGQMRPAFLLATALLATASLSGSLLAAAAPPEPEAPAEPMPHARVANNTFAPAAAALTVVGDPPALEGNEFQ